MGFSIFYHALTYEGIDTRFSFGFGSVFLALGLMSLVTGVGLWRLKNYGRMLQVVSSCIGLLALPLGTIISGLVLWYFLKPGVRVLFSEKPVAQLSPVELGEINKLGQSFAATVILRAGVVVAFIGIVAAIATPSLLRAWVSANEAAVIDDLKQTLSAADAYGESNGGYFDSPECLMSPVNCIPAYPHARPVFLPEPVFGLRLGYQREFHPGPPARENDVDFAKLSPSSITSFALVAYPAYHGLTGIRSFCFDSALAICFTVDGSIPGVSRGRCDDCLVWERW